MIASIRKALERHLSLMTPALATAFENVTYTPQSGVPYQKVYLMPAEVGTVDIEGTTADERGLFQVTLMWPNNKGTAEPHARAEAIRQHFKPGTVLSEAGQSIRIDRFASVAQGFTDGDRWALPVTIRYRSFI